MEGWIKTWYVASRKGPNEPHLLIFTSLCDFLPHYVRVGLRDHRIWQKWWNVAFKARPWKTLFLPLSLSLSVSYDRGKPVAMFLGHLYNPMARSVWGRWSLLPTATWVRLREGRSSSFIKVFDGCSSNRHLNCNFTRSTQEPSRSEFLSTKTEIIKVYFFQPLSFGVIWYV